MLKKLFIQNYALIDHLELDFQDGLNVITGETGAGKSIIIGALGLVFGNRADNSSIDKQKGKCVIEAYYNTYGKAVLSFLQHYDLDIETELTLRREIAVTGKSRAFINDTPVTLANLKTLSTLLVDVSSQDQTVIFRDKEYQISIFDDLANTNLLAEKYLACYNDYKKQQKQLDVLVQQEYKAKQQQDFIQFQFDELFNAKLINGEEEKIKTALEWMDNAEMIKQQLFSASESLSKGEDNIIEKIEALLSQLRGIRNFKNQYADLEDRLQSALIEIQDIAFEYESLNEMTEFNILEHNDLKDRMDMLLSLMQKHRKQSVEELLLLQNEFEEQLLAYSSIEQQIEIAKQNMLAIELKLKKSGKKLSDNRRKEKKTIEKRIEQKLHALGMKDAVFVIEMDSTEHFAASGMDNIDFLFTSNKGHQVDRVSKVASGGELSRLVLALKSLLSKNRNLPTIIFDEIDTGVSGDIAAKVGELMKQMSVDIQVIAITHLPQVAAKADWHYQVYKKEVKGVTLSHIRFLEREERLKELSIMISGDSSSLRALKMAEELMGEN